MKGKRNFLLIVAFLSCVVLSFVGCKDKSNAIQESESGDSIQNPLDSTIYGIYGESGMSTFCLIADSGDTIYLTRTSDNGDYGEIIGDLLEGDRFAMTMRKSDMSLVRAINLTQLNKFTKQYLISNCSLVLRRGEMSDTVLITWMNDDSLVVKYPTGKSHTFLPMQE